MKVPDQFSLKLARIMGAQTTAGAKQAPSTGGVSFDQQLLQDLNKAVQSDEAQRDAKVQAIKERIASGTYHVSSADLADSLLQSVRSEADAPVAGQSVEDLADALFRQNLQDKG